MQQSTKIAPSILSADFAQLGVEVAGITAAGADYVHVDVMDGHFVPNLTIGPMVVKALRPHSKLPFDVHLMIAPVDSFVPEFAAAGADIITFHPEAGAHPHRTVQSARHDRGHVIGGAAQFVGQPVALLLEELGQSAVLFIAPGELLPGVNLGGDVGDLSGEGLDLSGLVAHTAHGHIRPDELAVGVDVLLDDAVGVAYAVEYLLAFLLAHVQISRCGDVLPGLAQQRPRVVAQ